MPSSPHIAIRELTHVLGHHPATVPYGWLGASGTQDLRALRLWQSSRHSGAHSRGAAWVLRRVSLAEALLCQHIYGVARASSAGTKSGSSARSLVLCTPCWRLSRDPHSSGTSYSSTAREAKSGHTAIHNGKLSSPSCRGRRFASLPLANAYDAVSCGCPPMVNHLQVLTGAAVTRW